MFEKLKEKINEQIIESKRKSIFEIATSGNIGTYEIQDDKVICYVDDKLLKKYAKKNKGLRKYKLYLNGFYNLKEEIKRVCDECGILKPVYYIIEGIDFDSGVEISSSGNAHILFKNCSFRNGIKIHCANDIVFEDNMYEYPFSVHGYKSFLISNGFINNLKFVNDNFVNSHKNHPVKFGMSIKADNVEIINTYVKGDKLSVIELECDNFLVEGSTIICNEINVFSKNIKLWDDKIEANSGFIMDEETMYMDFDQNTRENKELEDSRTDLINVLRNLRDKCNQNIETKINKEIDNLEKKEDKLKNKKIKKLLK